MTTQHLGELQAGDALPEWLLPALTTEDIKRYAEASGDHNPLHTDPAFAQAAGLDGVIAHGMLVMGLMGRLATSVAGPTGLRTFGVRFRAMTKPGEALRCGGRIVAIHEHDGERLAECEIWARGEDGTIKAIGTFTAAL